MKTTNKKLYMLISRVIIIVGIIVWKILQGLILI